MNTKRLPEAVMVACLVALAVWWWWPVKPVVSNSSVIRLRPPSPTDEAPMPPASPPPNGPAMPPTAPVVTVDEPPAAATTTDPQADLSTAIPDFIRLFQSGDLATLALNYMPPDAFPPEVDRAAMAQLFQNESQTPGFQQRMQQEVIKMQLIQNMTPTYDSTGNQATYRPPDGSSPVVFVKVNGRWFRQD